MPQWIPPPSSPLPAWSIGCAVALLLASAAWARTRSPGGPATEFGTTLAGLPRAATAADGPGAFRADVIAALRERGHEPVVASAASPAGDDDELLFQRHHDRVLVQCRHWRAGRVDVAAIQCTRRAMDARGVTRGVVLTSGRFTREAVAYAQGVNIRLIGGRALANWLAPASARSTRRG